jgi:hypothetical protein
VPAVDKKAFFGTLYALIEKSHDVQLLRAITRMVAHWIRSGASHETLEEKDRDSSTLAQVIDDVSMQIESEDLRAAHDDLMLLTESAAPHHHAAVQTLTSKEKCNFLLRMIRFDKIADAPLQAAFLDLVLQVSLTLLFDLRQPGVG